MSKIVDVGYDAVEAWYKQHGTLNFYVWFGLIVLKTHLKDRKLRAHLDARKGTVAIADGYRKARAPHPRSKPVRDAAEGAKLPKGGGRSRKLRQSSDA